MRGKAEIQVADNGREAIIISEIPYQVNKATLVAKIAELVNEKKINGISDVRDESDRDGLRIVVEVRRDAMANVVLSHLYKYTYLQSSFGVNNVALVNGRPRTLNLKDIIREFIKFRIEVIIRRTRFDLKKAISRAHILVGLLIALDYLDQVIDLIRASSTPEEAREGLMRGDFIDDKDAFWAKFRTLIEEADTEDYPREASNVLSDGQARAILDMRLQKLTGLERDKIKEEYDEIQKRIAHLRAILESEELQKEIVIEELGEVKEKYGDERRTEISYAGGEISIEDMIPDEGVVVTISHLGYIKRTPVTEYRTQGRGGRGSRGSKTRDADFIEQFFVATTHNYLLLFTEQGKCYWLRVYEIPEASKDSAGRVIQNILSIPQDDKVKAFIIIEDLTDEDFYNNHYIVFCTRQGMIKKTSVEAYTRPRAGGIAAITINEGDQLLEARLTNGQNEIFIANRSGNAIRFNESTVRSMGRTAAGVRAISLDQDGKDYVVGMVCIDPSDEEVTILVISEKGMGKRTDFSEYRLTNRGGKGVKTLQVTDKTGGVVTIKAVKEEDDLMITNRSGIVIRMEVSDIRVQGRATQGVRLIRLDPEDEIADVAIVREEDTEDGFDAEAPAEGEA